jgi:hypothetical protein
VRDSKERKKERKKEGKKEGKKKRDCRKAEDTISGRCFAVRTV